MSTPFSFFSLILLSTLTSSLTAPSALDSFPATYSLHTEVLPPVNQAIMLMSPALQEASASSQVKVLKAKTNWCVALLRNSFLVLAGIIAVGTILTVVFLDYCTSMEPRVKAAQQLYHQLAAAAQQLYHQLAADVITSLNDPTATDDRTKVIAQLNELIALSKLAPVTELLGPGTTAGLQHQLSELVILCKQSTIPAQQTLIELLANVKAELTNLLTTAERELAGHAIVDLQAFNELACQLKEKLAKLGLNQQQARQHNQEAS